MKSAKTQSRSSKVESRSRAPARANAKRPAAGSPLGVLLDDIAALLKCPRRKQRDVTADTLRSVLDGGVSHELSTFLDWYAAYAIREVGRWRIAKPIAMNRKPTRGSTPNFDAAALAAATGTLYLGKDGSGARFFVERHPARSEVFLHDPGSGQLALLADSLRTFVEVNELMVRWDRLCETHDIDPDPDAIDDIDASTPGFAQLRSRAKALRGRVNLASGTTSTRRSRRWPSRLGARSRSPTCSRPTRRRSARTLTKEKRDGPA